MCYAFIVGSLMCVMLHMRPIIAHVGEVVIWYLSNPEKEHWVIVKWILRYLKSTFRVCLCFGNDQPILDGFIDVHMVDDINSRKFTLGCLITFA